MNILVCFKLVSQSQFSDSLADNTDRLTGGQLGINPADMYALELALRIKDKNKDAIVTVVTMAPDSALPSLREALAVGADRALHISDKRISGSDTLATARVLAAAIGRLEKQDLILCGKKSIDSETGHIAPQLSVLLSLPLASNVLSFSCKDGEIELLRADDKGLVSYKGRLPALLSVCNGTDMVRRPTIQGLRRSRDMEICRLDIDALGLSKSQTGLEGSPTRTIAISHMSFRKGKGLVSSSTETGLDTILRLARDAGAAVQ